MTESAPHLPGGAVPDPPRRDLLDRVDRYLDEAPRSATTALDLGAFTLFIPVGSPWPYYARPRRGAGTGVVPGSGGPARTDLAADIATVLAAQARLGLPAAFEWVDELSPGLAPALAAAGLEVVRHPLLALVTPDDAASGQVDPPEGVRIRRLAPDDPAIPAARVVASLGFGAPGTGVGSAGATERDERLATVAARDQEMDGWTRSRLAAGRTVTIVAEGADGVLAIGSHQPVGDATEIVGVATLPAARRRGLGLALTRALVADARDAGMALVLLSASDGAVAAVYERAGFTRIGHAGAAEPPSSP